MIERACEMSQFVFFVLDPKSPVERGRANTPRLRAHGDNGSEAFAREKIATDAGQQNRDRNYKGKCLREFFIYLLLRMQRLQDDQRVGLAVFGERADISAIAASFASQVLEHAIGAGGRLHEFAQKIGIQEAVQPFWRRCWS